MKKTTKETIIKLRKNDHTLNEIVEETGLSKTTIYYHIKNIPLSDKKRKEISSQRGNHLRQFATARKGKGKRKFREIEKWSKKNVLLLAHFIFDGETNGKSCIYHNRNSVLIDRVKKLMREIYDFEPKTKYYKKNGVTRISYHNVALSNYLKRSSVNLIEEIPDLSKPLKKQFLRGFFDDEGCIDFNGKTRRVRGYQHNEKILKVVKKLLEDFNIKSTIRKSGKEIVVSRRKNLGKFAKEINFSKGVKINGRRKNSIWGKNLEKRMILQKALDSYKD